MRKACALGHHPYIGQRQTDLLQITQAGNSLGLGLRLGQRGQQQPRQNCDDGDDDEQFNQRKPGIFNVLVFCWRDHALQNATGTIGSQLARFRWRLNFKIWNSETQE